MQWTDTNPEYRNDGSFLTANRLGGLAWLLMFVIVGIAAVLLFNI